MRRGRSSRLAPMTMAVLALAALPAAASSHREAPFVTEHPKVDGTDFYMFRSYEAGREGFVTLIANYNPLQDAYGGPNYFSLDPTALYRIQIDSDGDGVENLTFQFRMARLLRDIAIPVGPDGQQQMVSVPLVNVGQIGAGADGNQNLLETYTLQVIRGALDDPARSVQAATNADNGSARFGKPIDNIGKKSIPDYASYAASFIYPLRVPGCDGTGRVFVGQRREPFQVNLGETFDLVNITNPIGDPAGAASATADKNVTSFILEVPVTCLTGGSASGVIGGWTTAMLRRVRVLKDAPTFEQPAIENEGDFVQVSRLGMPLVNELVIGLKDKDKFNASKPKDDLQFATYVTNPTLPELLEILFGAAGVRAPNLFPRTDLLQAFVTGIPGLNELGFGEMQRLNVALPPTAAGHQNRLGVLGGDLAGFPNGRRPGDDVVDAELRVAMGALLAPDVAPSGQLPFTDGALVDDSQFDAAFPYLRDPLPGSPNSANGVGGQP